MRATRLAIVTLAGVLGVAGAALASDGDPGLERVDVRLSKERAHRPVTARIRIRGDLRMDTSLPEFDPRVDAMTIRIGGTTVFETPLPSDGVRTSRNRWSDWVVRQRRPFGKRSRSRLVFGPVSGVFDLRVSGVPAGALADGGAGVLPVDIAVAGECWSAVLSMRETGPRRWRWRVEHAFDGPIQDPIGGGGPPPGAPPPPSGPLTWTALASGTNTSSGASGLVVIRNAGTWASIWSGLRPGQPVPSIDFTREIVVGWVLRNAPPATGIGVQRIIRSGDGARVTFRIGIDPLGSGVPVPWCLARMTRVDGSIASEFEFIGPR